MANAKIISIIDHEVAAATNDLRFVTDNLRHDINTLAAAIKQLRQDVDQLKQGHQDMGNLKQGGGTPETSAKSY